jgi:hypothetical protein
MIMEIGAQHPTWIHEEKKSLPLITDPNLIFNLAPDIQVSLNSGNRNYKNNAYNSYLEKENKK